MLPFLFRCGLCLLAANRAASAAPLTIQFFDVGQGDAALITSPTGKTVLIDAGPPENAKQLAAQLAHKPPIDLAILTHRHADHLGGLIQLIQAPGILQLLDSDFPHPTPLYARLLEQLVQRQIPIRNATLGRKIDLGGGAHISLLAPPVLPFHGTRSDVNANSIVVRLDFASFSALFCGDAEVDTEKWLLASGQNLHARVVKVAHHGSGYSSTTGFVETVKPEVAIISVGKNNDYRHPDASTITRWQQAGAAVYRTDQMGTITISSDGDRISVASGPNPNRDSSERVAANISSEFVASRRGRVFHQTNCPAARSIKAANQIWFPNRAAALAKGRKPAQDCQP